MSALTALVVDDERPALEDLVRLLGSLDGIGEVEGVESGPQALRRLTERRFDVLFLDLRMPEIDGLELARVLKRFEHPPPVVFVSAYETGAVGAFEVEALDYVLKPVSRRRLEETVDRVRELSGSRPSADLIPLSTARGGDRLVSRDSILYCQAQGDYVRVVTDEGRFLQRSTISDIERRLSSAGFSRVHRGYIANLARAVEVRPMSNGTARLALANGEEIPIARRKVSELRRSLRS